MLGEAMKMDIKREARAKGRAEGRAEAFAEARAEGRYEEKCTAAKRMLALNYSLQDIMLFTELPLDQIHKLQAELKGDPFYSQANIARLEKAVRDIKNGRKLSQHELIEEE